MQQIKQGYARMRRYSLTDNQWEKISELLPGRKETIGVTVKDHRLFVEAVLYLYRAGNPWRDLPERFGDFRVVHTRHIRWSKTGVWERVFKVLSGCKKSPQFSRKSLFASNNGVIN